MKKTITLTVLLSISITVTYAQRLKPNSDIKAKHSSYKTDSLRSGGMFVHNDKNIYHNKKHNEPSSSDNLEKGDKTSTINAFKKVFNNQRLQQLVNEPNIGIEYTVSDEGKILEVSFVLKQTTLVTASELEELEDAIKKDVSFKWRGAHAKVNDFYVLFQNIRFSKILDGTLPE
jgi:hypothetical protein